MNKLPENFCILPWVSANLGPSGGVSICCASVAHRLEENSRPDDLQAIRNNSSFRSVRSKFLKGEWPKECTFCENLNTPGQSGHNMRLLVNERLKLPQNYTANMFTEDPLDLLELEINFGNICNFKCRMCSSEFSSRWIAEAKEINNPKFQSLLFSKPNHGEYNLNALIPLLNKLRTVIIKGGEPFLSPKFKVFLQTLVKNNISENCQIYVVTNGSIFDSEIFDLISKFKHPHVSFSIDGVEPIYSYIRDGSNGLKSVEENLKKACAFTKIHYSVNFTFQIYNMLRLYESVKFFRKYTPQITLLPVGQSYLHFSNAPDEIKLEVKSQFQRLLHEIDFHSDSSPRFVSALNDLEKPRNHESWIDFITYTKTLDKLRTQNFIEIEPRYSKYWQ